MSDQPNSPAAPKVIYRLDLALAADPDQVTRTQQLTLNKAKPYLGLRGTYGLFASREWWQNLSNRTIPLFWVSGGIERVYSAGQDRPADTNTITVKLDDQSHHEAPIYCNESADRALYKVGSRINILYAREERKPAPDGSKRYSDIVVEVSISV
jgi:hypothetical protein